jgi:hypothetical protein
LALIALILQPFKRKFRNVESGGIVQTVLMLAEVHNEGATPERRPTRFDEDSFTPNAVDSVQRVVGSQPFYAFVEASPKNSMMPP